MLERITALINGVIVEEDPSAKLSPEDVVQLIGEGFITKSTPFQAPTPRPTMSLHCGGVCRSWFFPWRRQRPPLGAGPD